VGGGREGRSGVKTIVDKYYDDGSLSLTTHDLWLRQRGSSWELKV